MNQVEDKSKRIIIIGAGMSGLCMAIRLKEVGFHNITILESSADVGGTWLKNTYPNAGCDIPSYLYSFSFAVNYDWSMKYARQPEIHEYFRQCADHYQILPHIRFDTKAQKAQFDESQSLWTVTTEGGERLEADILVSAVGQLNRPHTPSLPGLDCFRNPVWHSARWNHGFDLSDKSVAVIGNGASAIQFIPEIAKQARNVTLFQRTPSWIHPLNNYRYSKTARWALRRLPLCARLHRLWIYAMCDLRLLGFRNGSWANREYKRWLRSRMRKLIPSDQWETLVPKYAPGCKRVLLSSDYLQTLQRANVQVVSHPIRRFDRHSIRTDENDWPVDAVIFATGFKANAFLQPIDIVGRDQQSLESTWNGSPRAFRGISVSGFPNFFMLYGPNTNLGHNSIIFMVEQQVDFIVRCLQRMSKHCSPTIEVKQEAMDLYNQQIRAQLGNSIWAGDCTSWYKSPDGSIPNNWKGSATSFWLLMRKQNDADFEFTSQNDAR